MINIAKALKNDRLLKSLTGLTKAKFEELCTYFDTILKEERGKDYQSNPNRQRRPGGGAKGHLKTAKEKLFYRDVLMLSYFRNNPETIIHISSDDHTDRYRTGDNFLSTLSHLTPPFRRQRRMCHA